MPRLSKTKEEKQYEALTDRIRLYMLKRGDEGDTCHEAAARLGLSYKTLYSRRKSPGDFTLRELQGIANTLNVSIGTLLGDGQ